MKALPAQDQTQFRGESLIATSRLDCLGKLFGTAPALQAYIRQVKANCEGTGSRSQQSSADPMKALGAAAPSKSFEDLQVFDECKKYESKIMEANDTDEIEKLKKEASQARAPISDLIAACKSAASDINKGLKAREAAAKKRATRPSGKAVTQGNQADSFGFTGLCTQVPVIEEGAFEAQHFDEPCIIRCNPDKHRAFETAEAVKKFMIQDFLMVFNNHPQGCERAHRRFPPASQISDLVRARVQEICPHAAPSVAEVGGCNATQQSFDAVAVVVGKNTLACSPEKSHIGLMGSQRARFQTRVLWVTLSVHFVVTK